MQKKAGHAVALRCVVHVIEQLKQPRGAWVIDPSIQAKMCDPRVVVARGDRPQAFEQML